ncbi:hypothetical protein [Paenibacillus sp. FSL R7-0272]|uniref:hypothetical protein n=1 Tax=Paenibacillus sp. FSL R7-0272 TaxID=2921679 RepID=UPI0030ECEAEF
MADFAFHFEKIDFKKNKPNTLYFRGSCTNSNGREVTIKYTGADILNESSVAIPEGTLMQLKDELNNDYDYGPFDIKNARKALKEKGSYYFNFGSNE